MTYLVDTNACIALLCQRNLNLIARWQATEASEIVLCSVVVYELRYGAQRSSSPAREHSKLDTFLEPFVSLPFDDVCAEKCASIRHGLERAGTVIGPHDLQIAAIAAQHGLILVTHNTREFGRYSGPEI
ncbi:MAG: type II toxin-antitoxin system VapC family toxin [Candidatus Hydrogenedentes bacterium]|nr:type II toxin-antitoxin system VapC family toxin [Candidatus Hydrogenedentota bacterium]